MKRLLPHKLLPLMAIAAVTAGCMSDGFMLPDIDDGAARRGGTPIYPGPGDLPYVYRYPAPFGAPWYGYDAWPPYYYGPYGYGYGYGYGMGYGSGYGYWPYPPRPPVYTCRDANGDGRCDNHPNRVAQPRDPVQPAERPQPPRDSGGTPRSERERERERERRTLPLPPPPAPGISQRDSDRAPGSREPPDDKLPER